MIRLLWKLRYAYYLHKITALPYSYCFGRAELAILNDPDNAYIYGPKFYVNSELCEGFHDNGF